MKRFPFRVCFAVALAGCIAAGLPASAQMRMRVVPAGEPIDSGLPLPRDMMLDTQIGHGSLDIVSAWFVEPTTRYPHGILGDAIEAGAVQVFTRDGKVLTYRLPDNSVFEDLKPRVHDIDMDGREEVLVVHSRQQTGAALLALGVRNGQLVPIGETEPLGERFRWLNPVGVADVDNDGKPEIMVVIDPHTQGTLVIYRFVAGEFIETNRIGGVSNHVSGSREIGLSAILDFDGDGIPEVVLPSQNRRALRAIGLHLGRPLEQARINLPAPASGDFVVRPPYGLVVPLEDGRRVSIQWR